MKDIEVKAKFKGGGSFIDLPPKFSDSGHYCYIALKNLIYSYHTKTGKRILNYIGLENNIIGFDLYICEGIEYLTACACDGTIISWKIDTALKIKTTNLPQKSINTFKICVRQSNSTQIIKAVVSWLDNKQMCFGTYDLITFKWKTLLIRVNTKGGSFMDIGGKFDQLYVTIVEGRRIYIIRLNDTNRIIKKKIRNAFTCVACHPEEDCILTGDDTGRVTVWNGFEEENMSEAIFHWHTLPVKAVAFSVSGTEFYSGGAECVLVKWNMDNPDQRKFLPRLPSFIQQISISKLNVFIALAIADNSIQIIDPQFELVTTIQHLVMGKSFEAGIIFDPRTKALVMNGLVGHLQFYSPDDMRLLYNLDISGQNKLTSMRDNVVENTEIKKVAVNKTGLWVATVEEYGSSSDLSYEIRLKFFNFNTTTQTYDLNTSIEYPHEAEIKAIEFQPSNKGTDLRCVTISKDLHFKVWQLVHVTTVYSSGVTWRCASTASYRNLEPHALAFSYDGSLMAIPFQNKLTAWLPDSCELKCSLSHHIQRDVIKHVVFGAGNQCHLVVTASKKQLSVWNLITLTMIWIEPLHVKRLVADHLSSYVAAFTKSKKVIIFEPNSPDFVFETELAENTSALAATFVPSPYVIDSKRQWHERTKLYYIDSNKELYCLDANEEVFEPTYLQSEEYNNSVFNAIKPANQVGPIDQYRPTIMTHDRVTHEKILHDFLDMPCHTMPPMDLLCERFLMSLAIRENDSKSTSYIDSKVIKNKEEDEDIYTKIASLYGEERLKNLLT